METEIGLNMLQTRVPAGANRAAAKRTNTHKGTRRLVISVCSGMRGTM